MVHLRMPGTNQTVISFQLKRTGLKFRPRQEIIQSLLYCIWLTLGVKRAISEEWIWSLSCCVLHRPGVNGFLVNWRWSGFSVCFFQKNMRKEWENIHCTIFSELPNSNHCLFLNSKGLVRIEKGGNCYLKTSCYFICREGQLLLFREC